ncbi:hypothetical protein L2E82_51792 [Cichorium intybus]|nr:hypothetical protein L2E82_51792 [Cichorium intybus]
MADDGRLGEKSCSSRLEVVFDKGGILEEISNRKGYIDMLTIDAETSSKISEDVIAKGGSFLEAPVSRSKKPAEDGQLLILSASEKICYLVAISRLLNATIVILEIQESTSSKASDV